MECGLINWGKGTLLLSRDTVWTALCPALAKQTKNWSNFCHAKYAQGIGNAMSSACQVQKAGDRLNLRHMGCVGHNVTLKPSATVQLLFRKRIANGFAPRNIPSSGILDIWDIYAWQAEVAAKYTVQKRKGSFQTVFVGRTEPPPWSTEMAEQCILDTTVPKHPACKCTALSWMTRASVRRKTDSESFLWLQRHPSSPCQSTPHHLWVHSLLSYGLIATD